MPIFIREDREELSKKQIPIAPGILKHLQNTKAMHPDYKNAPGGKRLETLTSDELYNDRSKGKKKKTSVPTISFNDAKRFKSTMDNILDKKSQEYILNGGEKMHNYLNNAISSARGVKKVDEVPEVPKLAKPKEVKRPKQKEFKVNDGKVTLESRNMLKEDPDFVSIRVNKKTYALDYDESCAQCFLIDYDGSVRCIDGYGNIAKYHSDIVDDEGNNIEDRFVEDNDIQGAPDIAFRSEFVQGRFWFKKDLAFISFWDLDLVKKNYPQEIANNLDKTLHELGKLPQDKSVNDAYLDLGSSTKEAMTFGEYFNLSTNKQDNVSFDKSKIHMLSAKEKRETPQIKNYLQAKEKKIASKLNDYEGKSRDVSQAEYNFYKRYGLGESQKIKKVYLSESQIKRIKEYGER